MLWEVKTTKNSGHPSGYQPIVSLITIQRNFPGLFPLVCHHHLFQSIPSSAHLKLSQVTPSDEKRLQPRAAASNPLGCSCHSDPGTTKVDHGNHRVENCGLMVAQKRKWQNSKANLCQIICQDFCVQQLIRYTHKKKKKHRPWPTPWLWTQSHPDMRCVHFGAGVLTFIHRIFLKNRYVTMSHVVSWLLFKARGR